MKFLKWLSIVLLVIATVTCFGIYRYLKSTIPAYSATVHVQGTTAPVEIVRDSHGVPHIFAESERDAYFALGYCMAQDRLFQLEVMRLLSQGRLSELMGEGTVEIDKLYRTIHCAHDWDEVMRSRGQLAAPVENAFIDGINAYIEEDAPLSVPFALMRHRPQPFTPMDMYSLVPLYAWMTTSAFSTELLKGAIVERFGPEAGQTLFVDHFKDYPTTIPEGEPCYPGFTDFNKDPADKKTSDLGPETAATALNLLSMAQSISSTLDSIGVGKPHSACNSLVISAEKTGTGKPLLAQDFHFPFAIPSYLYEAYVSTPDNKVGGYMFVGFPYVFGGQNEHMAWVFTAGQGDEADFYIQKLDPDDPNRYLYRDSYEEMTIKKEIIEVRDGESVEHTVRLTRHGPVMDDLIKDFLKPDSPNTVISMRMASVDCTGDSEGLYRMNIAKNADEFLAAMEYFKVPGQNWIYADDNGEIGFIYGGAIPIRKGFDGSVPVPGWTGEFEWQGYVPTNMQPQLRNPKMGFINTSNAKPAPDYYPFPLSDDYSLADRLMRVREIIEETIAQNGKFTADDVNKVFADSTVLMARDWIPLLLEAAKDKQFSPNEEKALDALARWNFVSDKDSTAALIFQAMLERVVEDTFSKRLGTQLYGEYLATYQGIKALKNLMLEENSIWFDDPDTPQVEGRADLLTRSFKESVAWLEEKQGTDVDRWKLGDALTLTLHSPLSRAIPALSLVCDVGPLRMCGGTVTPFQIRYAPGKPFEAVAGSQARFVVDFSDRRNCKIVNMPGISENFMSPHYKDQVQMWYDFQFRPLALYREEADKDAKYLTTLLPE